MTDEEALAALKAAVTQSGRFRIDDEAVISQVLRSYEGMREAANAVAQAERDCPVQSRSICPERCPKCGATENQNCGPQVTAAFALADVVRKALQSEAL